MSSTGQRLSFERPVISAENRRYTTSRLSRNETPLPSADDWAFRVKVISSTSNLTDDVFKKAVQGLVNICFPSGVLEELGMDLLARHMREERAPQENTERTRTAFSSEMTVCIGKMLAEYLDTSEKVKSALRSILLASIDLHTEVDTESFLDILRDLTSKTSTPVANNTSPLLSSAIPQNGNHGQEMDEWIVDAEEPTMTNLLPIQQSKKNASSNKKVSATWRWNVEENEISAEKIKSAFMRPSDLFAFHALPLAKHLLAAHATRKEIRSEIQKMIDEMSETVYGEWVNNFHRLQNGDETACAQTART